MPTPQVSPAIQNEVTLARYPFLPQATEWIQGLAIEHDIDLDELLDGEWMEKARSRARIRLIDSIESKEGVALVGGDIFTEEGRIIEAFSFYYARLVVFASEDERLISRWAQAEATRAEQILIKDSENLEIIAKTFISNIEKDIDISQRTRTVGATTAGSCAKIKMVIYGVSEWQILSKFVQKSRVLGGASLILRLVAGR